MENKKYHTSGTVPNSNRILYKKTQSVPITHKDTSVLIPGLVQTLKQTQTIKSGGAKVALPAEIHIVK